MKTTTSWHERPAPVIALGLALIALCAGCAYAWLSADVEIARTAGALTGGAGIFLLVSGVVAWRDTPGSDNEGGAP